MVIWITGLSGAGKTTIARALVRELRSRDQACLWLDGDEVREAIADPSTGHDPESRLRNAWRICRLARLAERQGLLVVVSTMSLFHRVHAWNRDHLERYLEVLVTADLDRIKARDERQLYARQERGEENHVVGVDIEIEEPVAPDLVLDNTAERQAPDDHVERIVALLRRS